MVYPEDVEILFVLGERRLAISNGEIISRVGEGEADSVSDIKRSGKPIERIIETNLSGRCSGNDLLARPNVII